MKKVFLIRVNRSSSYPFINAVFHAVKDEGKQITIMNGKPPYVLHATAIVGCGISLFFCLVSLIGFSCFRPRTESMLIKKHLTLAVCATQTIFLVAIEGYKEEIGCRILSSLLHLAATACFTWCALDALGLYFFHANSFHPIRNTKLYLLLGWGVPCLVLILTLAVGLLDVKSTITYNLSLYNCWPSDAVVWTFVVPSVLVVVADIAILCTIMKQLRYPSYDISPKAVIEKRGTRYGLRTNSLMLLGLCVGWIFGILSLRDTSNLRFQLVFGLVNGLQGIFLFFFHCLLNTDHVKGYISTSGRATNNEEDGRSATSDASRSKKQDQQTSTKRKGRQRTSKLENVPLISLNSGGPSKQEEDSAVSLSKTAVAGESCSESVDIVSEPLEDQKQHLRSPDHDVIPQLPGTLDHDVIRQIPGAPDHDDIPQLPGTPDYVEEGEACTSTNQSGRKAKKGDRIRTSRPKTADNKLQVCSEVNQEKRRKSSSEPVISSSYEDSKRQECAERLKANERSSVQFHDRKAKRPARPHSSVNELESLFSRPDFFPTKPHRSSVSSLSSRASRDRKTSQEEKLRKRSSSTDTRDSDRSSNTNEALEESQSRTPSRNTQQTIL